MTNEQALEYGRRTGKFAPGRSRCMDCRCNGPKDCPGETAEQRLLWQQAVESELRGR